jgi:tRNA(fMet)-specific endonuclease VapC
MFSCAPTRAELMHGARKYSLPEARRAKVNALLGGFTSLPFDDACADRYGVIRDDLESRSCVIGVMDMQIADIALEHDLTLVTGNGDEFRRVHGLKVEDWSVAQT